MFQPFREQYPVNPSYEIARGLPPYLPPLRAKDPSTRGTTISEGSNSVGDDAAAAAVAPVEIPPVRITVHPEPIRVSYEVVRELVPKLWDSGGGSSPEKGDDDTGRGYFDDDDDGGDGTSRTSPDIVLHIGMAGPRPFYQIENRGHRQGYKSPDVDGKLLADERTGGHGQDWIWHDCPEEITTDLHMPDVLARWKKHSRLLQTDLRVSEDAGRYLCDFIYYSSLARRWRQGRPRRVTFLHVPADASERTVALGRELAVNLIRAVVESEVVRKTRPEGLVDSMVVSEARTDYLH
jgi:pyroglutamyl-peptidase